MNLLEHYIKDIHHEEPSAHKGWMEEPFVDVGVTIDCYGDVKRKDMTLPKSYWENAKERGYFMW